MGDRLPISVVIIAKNEAENLRRCLGSVCDWVTEIIVVLNDCTDASEAVVLSFGGKVYHHAWHGFRDQKNLALNYATQEWILSLDADEAVSESLQTLIQDFVRCGDRKCVGAAFPRAVWFLGRWIKHGEWYPDWSLRLFKKGFGIWGGGNVHEKLILNGPYKRLHGDLYHYSYPSLKDQLGKTVSFAEFDLQRQLSEKRIWSPWKVALRSFWRFFKGYIIKRGFLDGFPGFYAAFFMAFSTLFRYTRPYEHTLQQSQLNNPSHES